VLRQAPLSGSRTCKHINICDSMLVSESTNRKTILAWSAENRIKISPIYYLQWDRKEQLGSD
jgi:hypothetical protein